MIDELDDYQGEHDDEARRVTTQAASAAVSAVGFVRAANRHHEHWDAQEALAMAQERPWWCAGCHRPATSLEQTQWGVCEPCAGRLRDERERRAAAKDPVRG